MNVPAAPRTIVVAGLSGDSGKTLVSLALALAARRRGLDVRAFKKGPDYIDAAWLSWASGHPAWNLDTWLAGPDLVRQSFERRAARPGLNIVEGNRGLFDGVDARGSHSTAELACLLGSPIVLVVNATKMTATAAAMVRGCQAMDPRLAIAGVVLNHVAGARHGRIAREAIEAACGVPVVGTILRMSDATLLPGRHLGLVTPDEHAATGRLEDELLAIAEGSLDVDQLIAIASRPGSAADEGSGGVTREWNRAGDSSRPLSAPVIGYVKDASFSFYYPDNLEALEERGARLVVVSALDDAALPPGLHALYIGGGFPETHGDRLAANAPLMASIRTAAERGLPIYAECGGLVLLARSLEWDDRRWPMAGVLPVDVDVQPKPQAHGYVTLDIDRDNPFYPVGLTIRGHEFHYSRIARADQDLATSAHVARGTGSIGGRDGLVRGNVWASFTHVHALATPEWAAGLMRAATNWSERS